MNKKKTEVARVCSCQWFGSWQLRKVSLQFREKCRKKKKGTWDKREKSINQVYSRIQSSTILDNRHLHTNRCCAVKLISVFIICHMLLEFEESLKSIPVSYDPSASSIITLGKKKAVRGVVGSRDLVPRLFFWVKFGHPSPAPSPNKV